MNRLMDETSPYLLQHANNPVDWYPWGDEAFAKAELEDKPVFLSIGYSTCHWCHVMAHESFEDKDVAVVLNRYFVCIKVDKEERPDIDSIYMNVCMALTGSGGWPMTIIMDYSGRPFFAGTYFPKRQRYGAPGLMDILSAVNEKWSTEKSELVKSADQILAHIKHRELSPAGETVQFQGVITAEQLIGKAVDYLKSTFDRQYGGFGRAPKFPTPHNLLFLLKMFEVSKEPSLLDMAEKTLVGMTRGGIFDHIGGGFSRYSTDEKWLAPHFEKMLYDNAMLLMAFTKVYALTQKPLYKEVVAKTIDYIAREMTNPQGGFYSAQDADSEGVEGKYYVFTPDEVLSVLGEQEGAAFCTLYDITENGNFEGKSIPNQIHLAKSDNSLSSALPKLYEYRKSRTTLHKDDKILTAWNGLMIAALAEASSVFKDETYMELAKSATGFIETNLCEQDNLFASFRNGKRTAFGFIDDYAFYIYALLSLYQTTLDEKYLERARMLTDKATAEFFDNESGGFYLYGSGSENLISRPKETYDGAIPSGNSVMTMNLLLLSILTGKQEYEKLLDNQLHFMSAQAADVPAGNTFFLLTLLKKEFPGKKAVVVLSDQSEENRVKALFRGKGLSTIYFTENDEYKLLNGKTTAYVCENNMCLPPANI